MEMRLSQKALDLDALAGLLSRIATARWQAWLQVL
jgi:hypothetical protein